MKHNSLQKFVCIFFVLSSGMSSVTAKAQVADGVWNNGVYVVPADRVGSYPDPTLFYQTGYRVEESDLRAPFVISKQAREVFSAHAQLREKMPIQTPRAFGPIVRTIYNYIEDLQLKRAVAYKDDKGVSHLRKVSYEKSNGISNWALAIKINRLAFCFSTEPKGVAAQIQEESSYNRNKPSNTGAVGFTQLTSRAIDEVNDQLGNRGIKGAKLTNIPYLAQSIRCYMGNRPFQPMFLSGVIPRGKTIVNDSKLRAKAKAWIMADVDRDLVYGQILLKVLLADAHDNGIYGEAAYLRAFKMYNGEPHGRDKKYAREIVQNMRKI